VGWGVGRAEAAEGSRAYNAEAARITDELFAEDKWTRRLLTCEMRLREQVAPSIGAHSHCALPVTIVEAAFFCGSRGPGLCLVLFHKSQIYSFFQI